MRLVILFVALLLTPSCKSGEDKPIGNSDTLSASRGDKSSGAQTQSKDPCLNLNIATAEQLMKLPGIGDVLAARIIDYRDRHGRFRRPEEIIIIEGLSGRKYRAIAEMICVS